MSLGYTANSIIGGPLDPLIQDQLKVRKDIVTKKSSRDDKEILYLNSTTGWVKMTSSVDVEGEKDVYTNVKAKNRVLLGGTISNNKQKGGIFNEKDTAYSKSDLLGYRPMAGINSFRVDTKNNFGTLRIASVDFKVNSVEELDDFEELFLRPGFSVLLEWGHSLYYNNQNNFTNTIETFSDSFFNSLPGEKIEKEIKNLKETSGGNYDGMYGIIKNFVWSYNLDGGYDCRVDIVSKGELIESLSMIISAQAEKFVETTLNYNSAQNTTALHAFLNTIKYSSNPNFSKNSLGTLFASNTEQLAIALEKNTGNIYSDLVANLNKVDRKLHIVKVQFKGDISGEASEWGGYITFSTLLQLLNQIFILKNEHGDVISFFAGSKGNTIPCPFLTFDEHFALDPQICILPKGKSSVNRELHYKISEQTQITYGENDLLNIYLNIDFLLQCADKAVKSEGINSDSVYDFLNDVLSGVQNNLGGINDFDIHFEEELSSHFIVDRTITPNEQDIAGSFIDIVGLSTTLENLRFASKLSNNITTIMAISAQAGKSDSGKEMLAMQTWQVGLQDRHNTKKNVGSNDTEETAIPPEEDKKRLREFIEILNTDNNQVIEYNKEDIEGLEPSFKLLVVKLLEEKSIAKNTNPAGLIPFELSFTMKGLSGMKIGQAFKISDEILPKRYRKSVGFLITGVSHTIRNNRWVTDIKTKMIITKTLDKVK